MINFKEKYKELFEKDKLKDRKLNKIEVLALITYRYYLVKINKEPSWITKNKEKVLKVFKFIERHNLETEDLPSRFDTLDPIQLKIMLKDLKHGTY